MPRISCLEELRTEWFPHITDGGLNRVIELLEMGSPLLISGCFTRAIPMGCIATQIAWHHPATESLTVESGITWLGRVARLNPATSKVIREWDCIGPQDWEFRSALLEAFKQERERRRTSQPSSMHECLGV